MQKITEIANKFDIGQITNISEFGTGLINQTYLIESQRDQRFSKFVLQRLHKQIGKEVIIDINEITKHLRNKGFLTPTLVKTKGGGLFIEYNRETWRVLTFIEGKTIHKIEEKSQAQSAGTIVGRFHTALLDCNHIFLHNITNFHDTDHIIRRMNTAIQLKQDSEFEDLSKMSRFISSEYENINGALNHLPDRIIHGDLKLANIMFDKDSEKAISLIDLDTMARNKIAIDAGDALRSMCNDKNSFDLETFTYFIDGYFSEAPFLTKAETQSISTGVETIVLELAARYITDAVEQSYFSLDNNKFPDLYTQNRTKAESNIELYRDFVSKKEIIEKSLRNYL